MVGPVGPPGLTVSGGLPLCCAYVDKKAVYVNSESQRVKTEGIMNQKVQHSISVHHGMPS